MSLVRTGFVPVEVGPHPNGLAYDRRWRRLYSFNLGEPFGERCSASIVDLASLAVIAELSLPGRPRWALYDDEPGVREHPRPGRDRRHRLLADGDRAGDSVPSEGPHGLWLDAGRLFCAADGGAMVVLDRDTGDLLASLPLPGVPDVVMHDADLHRLDVAIGDPGVVCSFDSARLEPVETVETEEGAHTIGWDPDGRRLYVFCPGSSGAAMYEEQA